MPLNADVLGGFFCGTFLCTERCQSGRMGIPGKDVWRQRHRGFESLSLRHEFPREAGEVMAEKREEIRSLEEGSTSRSEHVDKSESSWAACERRRALRSKVSLSLRHFERRGLTPLFAYFTGSLRAAPPSCSLLHSHGNKFRVRSAAARYSPRYFFAAGEVMFSKILRLSVDTYPPSSL